MTEQTQCQYCGSTDCHHDCDESQAGGFTEAAQHTPGPGKIDSHETPWTEGYAAWAVEYGEPFGTTNILFSVSGAVPGEEEVVARLLWEPGADDERQAELRANARLIAAAPALLEELKKAVGELDRLRSVLLPHHEGKIGEPSLDFIDDAQAAIALTTPGRDMEIMSLEAEKK